MNVAIIGGGPAGMLAAIGAAQNGHRVTLYEQNEKLGKKLFLTGKGRCNITNASDQDAFFSNIARNAKFLYSAWNAFDNEQIVSLLHALGVPTKVERGNRVFPASDKSSDVLRALSGYVYKLGVTVVLNQPVKKICVCEDRVSGLHINGEERAYDAVVLATGGVSYPSTGSTGDGYRFAEALGHTIVEPKASLVPLETVEDWPCTLSGLALRNVSLSVWRGNKRVFEELGELLFAHFGVTGPLVLSASAVIAEQPEGARLCIDLKPGLQMEQLDRRMLRDLEANQQKQLVNALHALLPQRLIPVVVVCAGIDPKTQVSVLTREERKALCTTIKGLCMTVQKTRPIEEAIITRGGVCVKEINPSSMESKLVQGLYFAGEVMDVDGYTGGYNLQIAYSTGYLAGQSI